MKKMSHKGKGTCRQAGLILAVALAWPPLAGCRFHRTVVNEHVRTLDPSALRIGETTWTDAIRELGPPVSANTPQKLLRAELNQRSLRYVAAES